MREKRFLVAIVLVLAGYISVYASGYCVHEIGAKAVGMAGAFIAYADDPTAVWLNPAALTQNKGSEILFNLDTYLVDFTYTTLDKKEKANIEEGTNYVPYLAFASDLGTNKLRFGIAAYAPWGLSFKFPQDGPQRFSAYEVSLRSLYITPVVAYQITPRFSMGLGISFINSELSLYQKTPLSTRVEWDTKMDVDKQAFGANIGFFYKANERVSLAARWVSPVKMDYEGDIKINTGNTIISDSVSVKGYDFPQFARIGALFKASLKLNFTCDLVWVNWGAIDQVEMTMKEDQLHLGTIIFPKDWEDIFCIRLGGEYKLSEVLAIRGGWFYDQSAIPDETMDVSTVDAPKNAITLGFGYDPGRFKVDLAYEHVFYHTRTIKNSILKSPWTYQTLGNGEYEQTIGIIALNLAYRF